MITQRYLLGAALAAIVIAAVWNMMGRPQTHAECLMEVAQTAQTDFAAKVGAYACAERQPKLPAKEWPKRVQRECPVGQLDAKGRRVLGCFGLRSPPASQ